MRLLRKSQEAPLQDCTPLTLNPTWRFMGSYKWGYKSPNKAYTSILTLLKTLLITTHEPPSAPGSASLQLWEYRNQKSLNLSTICTLNPNRIRGQGQKNSRARSKISWARSNNSWARPKLSKRILPTIFLTLPTNFLALSTKIRGQSQKFRGQNSRNGPCPRIF